MIDPFFMFGLPSHLDHSQENVRRLALQYAWAYIGAWYKWGGDDPDGFDCSGYVCETLTAVSLLNRGEDLSAASLYQRFKEHQVKAPYPGCLVFYSSEKNGSIVHVEMMYTDRFSLGASGGGSNTLTVKDAIRDNAFIKMRDIYTRSNIFGYVDPFLKIS